MTLDLYLSTLSDIDYVAPPNSIKVLKHFQHKLPKIDPTHGIIPRVGNPHMGPVIRFEPLFSMRGLHRFWFNFERIGEMTPLNLGCGVTAYNYDDAIALLQERVFSEGGMPKITRCIPDVDVSTLEPNHVLPNLGFVVYRGIWFPQGYE